MAGKSLKWRDVALNGGKNPSPIPLAYTSMVPTISLITITFTNTTHHHSSPL